tara:strand:- start:874 stop:1653 length:780 start_codon:yes stop_codon:yes gene_type:complete
MFVHIEINLNHFEMALLSLFTLSIYILSQEYDKNNIIPLSTEDNISVLTDETTYDTDDESDTNDDEIVIDEPQQNIYNIVSDSEDDYSDYEDDDEEDEINEPQQNITIHNIMTDSGDDDSDYEDDDEEDDDYEDYDEDYEEDEDEEDEDEEDDDEVVDDIGYELDEKSSSDGDFEKIDDIGTITTKNIPYQVVQSMCLYNIKGFNDKEVVKLVKKFGVVEIKGTTKQERYWVYRFIGVRLKCNSYVNSGGEKILVLNKK